MLHFALPQRGPDHSLDFEAYGNKKALRLTGLCFIILTGVSCSLKKTYGNKGSFLCPYRNYPG